MATVIAWGAVLPQWVVFLKILLCIVFLYFLVRAIFRLVGHVDSSDSKTSSERYHWLLYPWCHKPVRAVVMWGLATVVAILFLFITPSAKVDKTVDTSNESIEQKMQKTKVPTEKDLQKDAIKKDKETRKENFKNVDSPGIHYKPPKIDPEKNIDAILKRTKDRNKKENKK